MSLLCSDTYHSEFDNVHVYSPFARPTCWAEIIGRCEKFLDICQRECRVCSLLCLVDYHNTGILFYLKTRIVTSSDSCAWRQAAQPPSLFEFASLEVHAIQSRVLHVTTGFCLPYLMKVLAWRFFCSQTRVASKDTSFIVRASFTF
jgi:hypothetical protein